MTVKEIVEKINSVVNDFIWGVPAMVCILGVGFLLSVKTGFIQLRRFGYAMQQTIGKLFHKKDAKEGALTPFQAVCTALAATVGTGNIAGVAGVAIDTVRAFLFDVIEKRICLRNQCERFDGWLRKLWYG